MAQEHAPNKPVHLIYLCGGLLLFFLLQWTTDWIWGYFTRAPDEFYVTTFAVVVAMVTGIVTYRHEGIYQHVCDVTNELKKVTWPGSKEVKQATIVVVFMTVLCAAILGVYDLVWSNLTEFIYG